MPYLSALLLLLCLPAVTTAVPDLPPLSVNEPTKGILLVADRSMPDPRFQQTVILILEHDSTRGTLGLVLNRPSDVTLANALPDLPKQAQNLALGWGGPVSQSNLFLLLRTTTPPEESDPVFADIVWSASAKVLETLIKAQPESDSLRIFFGLASWAPGQLENELAHSGWKLFQAQTDTVFNTADPVELWRHFIDAPVRILAQTIMTAPFSQHESSPPGVPVVARRLQNSPHSASVDMPF